MSNDIVKSNQAMLIQSMDDAERAARAMSASGFFTDAKSASQAIVKILAGQELGFGPFASMTGVNIIQNKPVLAANLLAAAVKRTGKYNYRVTVQTEKECVLTWYEGGQPVGKSSFTMDEATRAGLSQKDNWKKYPSDMLFARALSRGQKRYAPDIFNGAMVYTPDELGADVDDEGYMVQPKQEQEPGKSSMSAGVPTAPAGEKMYKVSGAEAAEFFAKLTALSKPEASKTLQMGFKDAKEVTAAQIEAYARRWAGLEPGDQLPGEGSGRDEQGQELK